VSDEPTAKGDGRCCARSDATDRALLVQRGREKKKKKKKKKKKWANNGSCAR